ncbi:MAG TPA: PAS domain-containing protein [Gemmatimonadaceae bacterium]|nr:PAS domain-containing protein [Gemmatimonadaceae bacterium]
MEELLEGTDVQNDLSRVVDALPGLVWTALPDGDIDFLNQRWCEYTGLSAEEAQGRGWQAAVHPDDLHLLLERWPSEMAGGARGEMEARLRRFDGEYRWFLFRTFPLVDASGQIEKWCGMNTDIDDRRRREKNLRAIETNYSEFVESFPGLMVTMTLTGQVELFSADILQYFGKTPDELRNWQMSDAVHPDDLPRVITAFTEAVTTGKPYCIEHRCRRADGVYRWFQVRALAVRDKDGQITGWYVVMSDIDDLKHAETELRRAYDSFADAQRLSHTGSFITDLVGDDHNWSVEAYRIFEFEPGSKISVQRIQEIIHPDDLPGFQAMIARGMSGVDVNFAFRIVTFGGAVKHVRGIAHVVETVDGRPMFVGALQDVTETMVAEEALNLARSELAHVARAATLSTFTASMAHEVNQPLSGIITNASTCLRMLDADPPNVDGARETARRTIRDGNRASDVIARLRTLFSSKEFTLEPLDLNDATREVIALSLSELQRDRVIIQSELADDLPPALGDRVQLQLVIRNLLRNASDAMADVDDRPRQLTVRTELDEGDRVRLSVQDVGAGFEPQNADKLFAPFFTTKVGGMGIGLSVSRSIIESHHGRLSAASNEGRGATFSFSIPRSLEAVETT